MEKNKQTVILLHSKQAYWFRPGLLLLFIFLTGSHTVHAQLIYNGDFSIGSLNCRGPSGWRSNNNVQVANVYQPGNNWVDITGCVSGNGNWIEQDVQVTPGTIYFLKLDLGSWYGWDDEDAGVFVTINGKQLGPRYFNDSFTGSLQMKLLWKTINTCTFIPETGTITIRITGHGLCTRFSPQRACDNPYPGVMALDNVVLEPVSIQTPEQVCLQNGFADLSFVYTGERCDYSFEWQKDGVTVSDDSAFRTSVPGTYILKMNLGCVLMEDTVYVSSQVFTETRLPVCESSIIINGQRIIGDADVKDTFTTNGGCDSIVTYLVRFRKNKYTYRDQKFFFCENGIDSAVLHAGIATSYLWLPDGQTSRTIYTKYAGLYRVVMRDSIGCTDTARFELVSSCVPPAYIPTSFSPNGDGKNDVFLPVIPGAESFRLQIFNRWGELLYDSFDTGVGWNGYYKQILCQQSAYLYILSFVARSSRVKYNLSGTITLLR